MKKLLLICVATLTLSAARGQDLVVTAKGDSVNCLITQDHGPYLFITLTHNGQSKNIKIEKSKIVSYQKDYYLTPEEVLERHAAESSKSSVAGAKVDDSSVQPLPKENDAVQKQVVRSPFYLGLGFGFDYGGFGLKVEYLPIKNLGLFAGFGYNLLSVGWNVGASLMLLPDKRVCPKIMAFYGYNAVFKGVDSYTEKYNMTSYGFTLGFGLDFLVGSKGDKISVALFVPIRSSEFEDNYNAAKNDHYVEIKNNLPPIGISLGYNFAF